MLEYDENEKNDCNNNNNIESNVNQREGCECGRERERVNNLQNIQIRMSMPILRRRPNSGRLCIGSGDIFSDDCTGQCFSCCNDDDDVDELDKLAEEWIDDGWCDDGLRFSNSGILWPKLSCPCVCEKLKEMF